MSNLPTILFSLDRNFKLFWFLILNTHVLVSISLQMFSFLASSVHDKWTFFQQNQSSVSSSFFFISKEIVQHSLTYRRNEIKYQLGTGKTINYLKEFFSLSWKGRLEFHEIVTFSTETIIYHVVKTFRILNVDFQSRRHIFMLTQNVGISNVNNRKTK